MSFGFGLDLELLWAILADGGKEGGGDSEIEQVPEGPAQDLVWNVIQL